MMTAFEEVKMVFVPLSDAKGDEDDTPDVGGGSSLPDDLDRPHKQFNPDEPDGEDAESLESLREDEEDNDLDNGESDEM